MFELSLTHPLGYQIHPRSSCDVYYNRSATRKKEHEKSYLVVKIRRSVVYIILYNIPEGCWTHTILLMFRKKSELTLKMHCHNILATTASTSGWDGWKCFIVLWTGRTDSHCCTGTKDARTKSIIFQLLYGSPSFENIISPFF